MTGAAPNAWKTSRAARACEKWEGMTRPLAAEIIVADDQDDVLVALRLLLAEEDVRVAVARSPAEVLALVRERRFDAALLDLNYTRASTTGREGLALLRELRALDPDLPVIVMTAWGTVASAVAAMRDGARDFIEKPWDNQRLSSVVRTQVALGRALRDAARLRAENVRLATERFAPPLVGSSAPMQNVLRVLGKVAPSDATVLITGEHGTGKEVVARHVHAASKRAGGPFIAVNAGGYSDGVFESELFGHVKGAFTDAKVDRKGAFEAAHTGTLFLDEVGNMPLSQQGKLLRTLQTGEFSRVGATATRQVQVRVIAATNLDLALEVKAGRFREDLLYRLNTVEICLPPLRERGKDIVELSTFFLQKASERSGLAFCFDPDALQRILEHRWPGNVRELGHAIERGVLLAEGSVVRAHDLCLPAGSPPEHALSELTLEAGERFLVSRALERSGGNVSQAAQELGISRASLYRRLERHGITLPER
jgi:DNA-binding NtrC family response regulator